MDVNVSWFVDDDAGYLDWLTDHSGGYVLNTAAKPTASYLLLHRAGCRSVNRPTSGRRWTHLYGKACASSFAALVAWAQRETGGATKSCRLCLG